MDSKQLLAVAEAAAYLGVTKQAVYQFTKQGLGTRVGNMWVFTKAELDGWRTIKSNARDMAVVRPGSSAGGQPVVVSQRRPQATKLPMTVNIDGTLHWAADATTTLCGKYWSAAQIVRPSANVCSECRTQASKRGL
ncbi:MAG: helix-turn-helix domain-containing protein [Herpetosiphonaceae bacterium]|nr:helix-turn-helix domain-containing protein [Herpetosiphonaceae bacterium]